MDPPDHTKARSVLSKLLTPSRLKQNEEFMWRLADRQLDEFLEHRRVRVHRRILQAVRHLGDRRPARCPGGGPQGVPHRPGRRPSRRAGGRARSRVGRHQPAGVARRQVLLLHRGPPQRSARRRADLAGDGEVPGRIHARGHRGGPLGHFPFRRRTGDHRQAAQRRAAGARRPARYPTAAARRPQPDSRVHRGIAAHGQPRQERLAGWPAGPPPSAASTFPPAPS